MKKYLINYEELLFLLKINKLNTTDLAEMIGVKRQTIYYWKLNGTSIDNIRVIAHYLKCNTEELVKCVA